MSSEATLSDVLWQSHSRDHLKETSKEIIVDTSTFDEFGGITYLTKNIIEQLAQNKNQWKFTLLLQKKNRTLLALTHLKNVRVLKVVDLFGYKQKSIFNLLNISTFGLMRDKLIQLVCYGNIFLNKHTTLFWDPVGGRFINDFSIPRVTTIHDTIEIDRPELFDDKTVNWIKGRNLDGLKNSRKIITVSNFTKQRIMDIYGIDSEKICVIPIRLAKRLKFNTDIASTQKILYKHQLSAVGSYMIFVSQYYPNKNHKRLIQAFSNFLNNNENYKELKLVIVGNMSRSNGAIEQFAKQCGIEKNVVFTGKVDEEELSILLQNALCFIHPSVYEGFGMPLVEAMSSKIPVACSNISSLPEITEDAAIYFDPYDVADIEKTILSIVNSPELRKNLIKKGETRSKKFEDSYAMINAYIKIFEDAMVD